MFLLLLLLRGILLIVRFLDWYHIMTTQKPCFFLWLGSKTPLDSMDDIGCVKMGQEQLERALESADMRVVGGPTWHLERRYQDPVEQWTSWPRWWLLYIADEILPRSYMVIFISHDIRIPSRTLYCHQLSTGKFCATQKPIWYISEACQIISSISTPSPDFLPSLGMVFKQVITPT